MELLEKQECDARIISQNLKIREKEVYQHIPHIIRSAAAAKKKLIITPSQCNSCGYHFKDRKKPSKPGRCPECRKERIDPPRFKIE